MSKKNKIELRSEKVRRVIGRVPPTLVRIGTVIITVILAVFAVVFCTVPYPISIETEGVVSKSMPRQNGVHVEGCKVSILIIKVPYKYLYLFNIPRTASVTYEGIDNPPIRYSIRNHSSKLIHGKSGNYFIATATITDKCACGIKIQPDMKADVRIIVSDKTLWQQMQPS